MGTGKVSYFILLPMESFDMETYTDAYLLFEGASQLMTYSDAYEQLVEERTDQLEPLSKERAQLPGRLYPGRGPGGDRQGKAGALRRRGRGGPGAGRC